MNPKLKKILSLLFIVCSVAAVLLIAFNNAEVGDVWAALGSLNPAWLLGAFGCWAAYLGFESLSAWLCLRHQGCRISLGRTLIATVIGLFYSNITPGAAGGQPMEVYTLRKAGVSVGYGTMMLTIRFAANQLAMTLLGLVLFLINRDFVYKQLSGMIWVVRLGWVLNFSVVPIVLLAAFRQDWIRRVASRIIRFLAKIRILKKPEVTESSVFHILESYHEAMVNLFRAPGQVLLQFFGAVLAQLGLASIVVCLYRAFGFHEVPVLRLLTLAMLLYISVSYTPLPGASGAQEGGFLIFYQGIFTGGTIGVALLVWRFFNYYLSLLVGALVLILERLLPQARKDPDREMTEGTETGPGKAMTTDSGTATTTDSGEPARRRRPRRRKHRM